MILMLSISTSVSSNDIIILPYVNNAFYTNTNAFHAKTDKNEIQLIIDVL